MSVDALLWRNVYIQDSSFIGFERPDTNYNLRPKKHEGLVFVLPFKTAVRFERVAADPTCRGSVQVFQCKRLR